MAQTNHKEDFPLLASGIAYLDNGATTQKPLAVLEAMDNYYKKENANVHRGLYKLAEKSTEAYEHSRKVVAKWVGKREDEIIFTSGATHSLNLAAKMLEHTLEKEDEILLTVAEHHSTFVPFQQLAKRTGAKLIVVSLNDKTMSAEQINSFVSDKTKIIAISAMSNVLGYYIDTGKIKKRDAILVVDAAQSIKHEQNYKNADLIAFSAHKMYGPMGIGVLAGNRKLFKDAQPLLYGGSMIHRVTAQETTWADAPAKFEAGTPNVAAAVGLAAAIEYYKKHQSYAIKHEKELALKAYEIISKYATVHSKKGSPILSFSMKNVHSHDVAQVLDSYNVCVRAGQHCCEPLHDSLQVKETVRVSLAFYNDEKDLEKLNEGLAQVKKVFA